MCGGNLRLETTRRLFRNVTATTPPGCRSRASPKPAASKAGSDLASARGFRRLELRDGLVGAVAAAGFVAPAWASRRFRRRAGFGAARGGCGAPGAPRRLLAGSAAGFSAGAAGSREARRPSRSRAQLPSLASKSDFGAGAAASAGAAGAGRCSDEPSGAGAAARCRQRGRGRRPARAPRRRRATPGGRASARSPAKARLAA